MPSSLKKFANYGKGKTIALLLVGLLLIGVCGFGIVSLTTFQPEPVPYEIGPSWDPSQPVYVSAQFAGYQFASFTDSGDMGFYLVFDVSQDSLAGYVLFGGPELESQLTQLQDYTYGLTNVQPEPVLLTGYPLIWPDGIAPYLVEAFNAVLGVEILEESMIPELLGSYYIDTTYQPNTPTILALWVLIVVCTIALLFTLAKDARRNGVTNRSCNALSEEAIAMVGYQLETSPVVWKHCGLVLTRDYLLSYQNGLQIYRIDQITNLTGLIQNQKIRLQLALADGDSAILSVRHKLVKAEPELTQLAFALSQRNPNLTFGHQSAPLTADPAKIHVSDFSVPDSRTQLFFDASHASSARKPNYISGILGALAGALAGGTVWILVGMLGYISGWIGLLIIYLSLVGFRKLGGTLDRAGAVMSFILAFLMIFPANYLVYALSYWSSASYISLSYAMGQVFPLLRTNGLMAGFLTDLLMGYGFTALVGIPMILRVLHPKTTSIVQNPNGTPVHTSICPPATNPAGQYLLQPSKSRLVVTVIVCLLALCLMGFFAMLLLIASDSPASALICLVCAVLFLWGFLSGCRKMGEKIIYDETGITYRVSSRKGFMCPWSQVVRLEALPASRYQILTAYGKIPFDSTWPHNEHLLAFAQNKLHGRLSGEAEEVTG